MKKLAFGLIAASFAALVALAGDAMPAAQQNELVQKYCAVCHNDARMVGGLTLQRFDAAHADPGLAAMLAAKLKDGAMGASGIAVPDRTLEAALLSALTAEGAGAGEWVVAHGRTHTASIVQQVPSGVKVAKPDLYRLAITCDPDSHKAEMQLAWAPADVAGTGAVFSAAVDGKAPVSYDVKNGEGNAMLAAPLPEHTLTISNVFQGQTVVFPFESLPPDARQSLAACFNGIRAKTQ